MDFSLCLTQLFISRVRLYQFYSRTCGVLFFFQYSDTFCNFFLGEHGSQVYGSIRSGIFEGKIHTKNHTYYVERTHKYGLRDQPYHSIIYSENDVHDPYAQKRESHIGGCAGTGKVLQWMQDISSSAVNDKSTAKPVKEDKLSEVRPLLNLFCLIFS